MTTQITVKNRVFFMGLKYHFILLIFVVLDKKMYSAWLQLVSNNLLVYFVEEKCRHLRGICFYLRLFLEEE